MPVTPSTADFNTAIAAKFAKSRLTRYQDLLFPFEIVLCSPEMKRRLARDFNGMQGNLYVLLTLAAYYGSKQALIKIDARLRKMIADRTDRVERQIAEAMATLAAFGIGSLTEYADDPIRFTVRVIDSHGRRYLNLIAKTDHLLHLLRTLDVARLIDYKELDRRKALLNRSVRQVAVTVRSWKMEREWLRTGGNGAIKQN